MRETSKLHVHLAGQTMVWFPDIADPCIIRVDLLLTLLWAAIDMSGAAFHLTADCSCGKGTAHNIWGKNNSDTIPSPLSITEHHSGGVPKMMQAIWDV